MANLRRQRKKAAHRAQKLLSVPGFQGGGPILPGPWSTGYVPQPGYRPAAREQDLHQAVADAVAYYNQQPDLSGNARPQLPLDVITRQIVQESGWDPGAQGTSGELGIGQFMPDTWRGVIAAHPEIAQHFGITSDPSYRSNGQANIYAMVAHMSDLLTSNRGNLHAALAAYNGSGPAAQRYADGILGTPGGSTGQGTPTGPLPGITGAVPPYPGATDIFNPFDPNVRERQSLLVHELGPASYDIQAQQNQIAQERVLAETAYQQGNLAEAFRHNQAAEALTAQLQFQQYQLGWGGLGVQQRGQDINGQLTGMSFQLQIWEQQRQDALARGDQQLAQSIEGRMRATMQAQNDLAQRAQDISIRSQDVQFQAETNSTLANIFNTQAGLYRAQGELQLGQAQEDRARALMQQQASLQAFGAQLQGYQAGAGVQEQAAGLLSGLSQQELQRQQQLAQLAANPRDWLQYQYATGHGQNFINQLLQGQPISAQGIGGDLGVSLLGPGFDTLVHQLSTQPTYDAAIAAAQRLQGMAGQVPAAPTEQHLQDVGQLQPQQPLPTTPAAPPLATQLPAAPPQVQLPRAAELPPIQPTPPAPSPPVLTYTPPAEVAPTTPYATPPATDLSINPATHAPWTSGELAYVTAYRQQHPLPPPGSPQVNPATGAPWTAPELDYVRAYAAQHPPGMAGGGSLMLNEPTVGIGLMSGQPQFTMGEEAPRWPELLSPLPGGGVRVTPTKRMAKGGKLGYNGGAENQRPGTVVSSQQTDDASPALKKVAAEPAGGGTYLGHSHTHDVTDDHAHEHAHQHSHGTLNHSHAHEHETHSHGASNLQQKQLVGVR